MFGTDDVPKCIGDQANQTKYASEKDGHGHFVWRGGYMKNLNKSMTTLTTSSTKEPILQTQPKLIEASKRAILKFFQKTIVALTGIPNHEQKIEEMCITEVLTCYPLETDDAITQSNTMKLKKLMPEVVWDCEDHQYKRLVGYCPKAFYDASKATMLEAPEVLATLDMPKERLLHLSKNYFPKGVRARHKWGAKWIHELPNATVIIKRKKEYKKGRPISRSHKAILHRLHRGFARAMGVVLKQVSGDEAFKKHCNVDTTTDAFKWFRKYNSKIHESRCQGHVFNTTKAYNRDLAGFFTSVPHERILDSLKRLLIMYTNQKLRANKSWSFTKHKIWVSVRKTPAPDDKLVAVRMRGMFSVAKHLLKFGAFTL